MPNHLDVSGLPENIKDIVQDLFQMVCYLQMHWQMLEKMAFESAETRNLLNDIARQFFGVCQHTVQTLIARIDPNEYGPLREDLDRRWEELCDQCTNLRKHRNRRIAHADLENATVGKLPSIDQKQVSDAIEGVVDIFYSVLRSFQPQTDFYTERVLYTAGVPELIGALQDARKYRALRDAERRKGNVL